jgi:pyruvate/2-oxoglutarate dehydrogenase complex dihydrolipoamide dehydrogenase (E3) component
MSALHDNADVAVLGGGPGGYVAALVTAQRGARVVSPGRN